MRLSALVVLLALPAWAGMTQLPATASPTARRSTGLAEQPLTASTSKLWIYGGFLSSGSATNQTWSYDTSAGTWTQVTPSASPQGTRERHVLGWDASQSRVVLFGGMRQANPFSVSYFNDVVAYDPSANIWETYTAVGTPPATRCDAQLAYMPSRSAFLVFGGSQDALGLGGSRFNDLFQVKLDAVAKTATWTKLTPSGTPPSARGAVCMGYDPNTDRLIVFGGEVSSGTMVGDTYEYDVAANAWSAPTVTNPPTARGFASCTFDLTVKRLVLYGGENGSPLGGAAVYEPVTHAWTPLTLTPNAGNRADAFATYSQTFGGMVFFGGRSAASTYTNQTWLLYANNLPPVVNAGPDFSVPESALVTLDGGATMDPLGKPLSFLWAQQSGPAVSLSNATSMIAGFTSPRVTSATQLSFALSAENADAGSSDSVTVTVNDTINEPPIADAGADLTAISGDTVALSGSATDPNNEALTLSWSQTAGPSVTLSGSNDFVAPTVAAQTVLSFQLTATDTRSGTGTDSMNVTVSPNLAPIAVAGPDQTVDAGVLVLLDGTGSSDPNGDSLSYGWSQLSGPAVALTGATSAQASFTAPSSSAQLDFLLTVTDSRGLSSQDGVTVFVDVLAQDAGLNDGGTADAGTTDAGLNDGGTGDAGTTDGGLDDGGSGDAGSSDAGLSDAGLSDGGSTDAGNPDGGSSGDAGQLADGGVDAGSVGVRQRFEVGCGCSATGSLLPALAFALFLARRRRR